MIDERDDRCHRSLESEIEELAAQTGAPDSFVVKVRTLFQRKGIGLEVDAGPYLRALREAFRREETLRRGSERPVPATDVARPETEAEPAHLRQLRAIRDSLRRQSRVPSDGSSSPGPARGLPRTYAGRPISPGEIEFPVVPGPKDVQ